MMFASFALSCVRAVIGAFIVPFSLHENRITGSSPREKIGFGWTRIGSCPLLGSDRDWVAYTQSQNYGQALECCNRAIAFGVYYADIFSRRSRAFAFLGEFGKSLADVNTALTIEPNTGYLYFQRSKIYKLLGRPGLAAARYAKGH